MTRISLAVLLTLLTLLTGRARADLTWETNSVPAPGGGSASADWSSMALDASGYEHIAYYSGGSLYYTYFDGTDWVAPTDPIVAGSGNKASLALDGSGNPFISYYDAASNKIEYYDGVSGSSVDVGSVGTGHGLSSLALGSDGTPHVAYQRGDASSVTLEYATPTGALSDPWDVQDVQSSGTLGDWPSLALTSTGTPCISYWDGSSMLLYAASPNADGTGWSYSTVGNGGHYNSLALDDGDAAHVAFVGESPGLYYASLIGPSWQVTSVDPYGIAASLDLTASDYPVISYWADSVPVPDEPNQVILKLAVWNGTSWDLQDIESFAADTVTGSVLPPNLAVAPDGSVHVTYSAPDSGALDYAVGTPEPATCVLALCCLALGGGYVRRRKRRDTVRI